MKYLLFYMIIINHNLNSYLYFLFHYHRLYFQKETTPVSSNPSVIATEGNEEKPIKHGFLLDKPWYYHIGLAVLTGAAMGVILSFMIMSTRQAPKNSSAYQSLLVLLKENKVASDILGDGVCYNEQNY